MRSARMITQTEAAIAMTLVIPNPNLVMSNSEPTTLVKRPNALKKRVSPGIDPMSSTDPAKKMIENEAATKLANFFFVEVTSLLLMSNTQQTLLKIGSFWKSRFFPMKTASRIRRLLLFFRNSAK